MKKMILVFGIVAVIVFGVILYGKNILGRVISGSDLVQEKIVFKGFDGKEIYGLLFYPRNVEKFDVVVVLPGGGGTKESRGFYADIFYEKGVGTLVLDQRGLGETGGEVMNFNDDFYTFIKGDVPDQMMMARDVSSAVEFLKGDERVDEIAVLGESMGGRYAMIAGAYDKLIKGVLVISSAGLERVKDNEFFNKYLDYIDPNNYVKDIAPRRFFIASSVNDNVVLLDEAKKTFELAGEPKTFVEMKNAECIHGYCAPMKSYILEEIEKVFGN